MIMGVSGDRGFVERKHENIPLNYSTLVVPPKFVQTRVIWATFIVLRQLLPATYQNSSSTLSLFNKQLRKVFPGKQLPSLSEFILCFR